MLRSKLFESRWFLRLKLVALASFVGYGAQAQSEVVPLDRLDFFKSPGKSWAIVGNVHADLEEAGILTASKGSGVLANIPTKRQKGEDLFTNETFGDLDLEVEYLMAKGSNSGIYLQGMYEVQLLDSWGRAVARSGDNGGIYERWDDSKPDGLKGYQGYAPRQNASKAPGLWQHLKISFQAPRFDGEGNKVANARMLRVELNGVLIHENVELLGPTRGAMFAEEVAKGPLRIQGDHGAVAFRNLKITTFDNPVPTLFDLSYELYEGTFREPADLSSLQPTISGIAAVLTGNVRSKSKQFLLRYTGKVRITTPGTYQVGLQTPGGGGLLKINGDEVVGLVQNGGRGQVELPAGEHALELIYAKFQDWVEPGLGLTLSGPGLREVQYSQSATAARGGADPIPVDPRERPVLRSFMDIPGRVRVTHAVSVGSEEAVHYTYDMAHGNLVQVWRGNFLDATPMWNSRGDGSSRPTGALVHLGSPSFSVARLASESAEWVSDSTGTGFKPKGYRVLGKPNHLAFQYHVHGAQVEDEVEILSNGQGVSRRISVKNGSPDLFIRVASGDSIQERREGLFIVDDKVYYVKVASGKTQLRTISGKSELLIPATDEVSYSILF
ncbi:putative cytochrome oxidase (cbb3-type) [Lunatimonas lonarensis]|uniref:Putative cytochrome oxidase (Cbb3-type) n=1 Tax=Lunatimonas lonarensis TaxID=1232681 RepID=R7ZLZ9_9BACT|nr:DUF1080 domain-containing protein [Lunatimonas lonarensis]EON75064.1 putative cytochrome oxidase (cbb3-type) [Lunatimonas lonarensis]